MGKAEVLPQVLAKRQGISRGEGSPCRDAAGEQKASPKLGLLKASRSCAGSCRTACLGEKEEKSWIFLTKSQALLFFLIAIRHLSRSLFYLWILCLGVIQR